MNTRKLADMLFNWITLLKQSGNEAQVVAQMDAVYSSLFPMTSEKITHCVCNSIPRHNTQVSFTCPEHGAVSFDSRSIPETNSSSIETMKKLPYPNPFRMNGS
jgi:hypothetical protein